MVKHTQTIRRLLPTNCLSVFGHFVGLALKELKKQLLKIVLGIAFLMVVDNLIKNSREVDYLSKAVSSKQDVTV